MLCSCKSFVITISFLSPRFACLICYEPGLSRCGTLRRAAWQLWQHTWRRHTVCSHRAHHTLDLDPPTLFQNCSLPNAQTHLLCFTDPRFTLTGDSDTFADLCLALPRGHGDPWTDGQNLTKNLACLGHQLIARGVRFQESGSSYALSEGKIVAECQCMLLITKCAFSQM